MSSETTSYNAEDGDADINNQFCTENQRESNEEHKEIEQCISIKTEEKISLKIEDCDSEVPVEHKTISNVVGEKANEELNNLSQIITEKLKFLSEGRESVSAVQTMQIQLQVSAHFYIFYYLFLLYYTVFNHLTIDMNFININYCIYYRHYLLHGWQTA